MAGSSNIEALAFIIRLPKRSVSTLQLNGKTMRTTKREGVDESDYPSCNMSLRLPSHHCLASSQRLACEREARLQDMAASRAEGSSQTTKTQAFMAQ